MSTSGSGVPKAVVQISRVSWMSTDKDDPFLWLVTKTNPEWMPWSR